MRPVARIAQSVEQGIENPRVRGSIPRPGTNILKTQLMAGFLLFWVSTLFIQPCDDYGSMRCLSLCISKVGKFVLSGWTLVPSIGVLDVAIHNSPRDFFILQTDAFRMV